MHSTLLTVIFTNPSATLLHYRTRLPFATMNRVQPGNNVAKSALIADVVCGGAGFVISV